MILAKAAYLQKKLSQLDSADILISLGIGVTVSTLSFLKKIKFVFTLIL